MKDEIDALTNRYPADNIRLKLTEVAVSHEYQASISRAFDAPSQ
jgi:hypothetical protein